MPERRPTARSAGSRVGRSRRSPLSAGPAAPAVRGSLGREERRVTWAGRAPWRGGEALRGDAPRRTRQARREAAGRRRPRARPAPSPAPSPPCCGAAVIEPCGPSRAVPAVPSARAPLGGTRCGFAPTALSEVPTCQLQSQQSTPCTQGKPDASARHPKLSVLGPERLIGKLKIFKSASPTAPLEGMLWTIHQVCTTPVCFGQETMLQAILKPELSEGPSLAS
ncbi:uncharacterized protein LOC116244009 isoform X2 [Phasianus colchicus]|uniref:uncharacterized protein LOC116244009 isoform X2 n=1 Tax=Phasianus colchicus TaxID=9054 RepID=UPI00129D2952|nr:uncharacterized protein LOC116244009 isoform X2 [Phasianus colchicus]